MAKKTLNMNQKEKRRSSRHKKNRLVYSARKCRFCEAGIIDVDYKDAGLIKRFLSVRGKILAGRFTGVCAKHQRKLSMAIKRSRFMGLIAYIIR